MKTIFKISVVTLLTLLCIFLIKNAKRTSYYPMKVSIELKSSEKDERCQVFYTASRGFSETQSINKYYSSGDGLQEIAFVLPAQLIRNIRIDPGFQSANYEIYRIKFQVENQEKVYSGDEILPHFILTNLVADTSAGNSTLTLFTAGNTDVQLLFNHHPAEMFETVINIETLWRQIIIIIIVYLFIVAIIFRIGGGIVNEVVKIPRRVSVYIFESRLIGPTKYSVSVVVLFLIKYFLVSAQQMSAYTSSMHDDALFVKLANSLVSGNWLGYYDSLTLAKGFGYPLFIAITNIVGIPLFLAQHILYGLASLLMVKAVSPVVKNPNLKIVLFAVLLFNPASSDAFTTRILRDGFYVSLSVMVVAAFVAMYLRRKMPADSLLKWGILGGIALFMHQNTREEGAILLPFILILTLSTLASNIQSHSANSFSGNLKFVLKNKKTLLWSILIPYLILIFLNLSLASINYLAYGGFIRNDIKSEPFSSAYLALTKIESEQWYPEVPVTFESREKAYHVSLAFNELREIIEHENNGFFKYSPYPNEILGAHFVWTFRYAAEVAGYHQSLPKSQEFYQRVADEINRAYEKGSLKKRKHILPIGLALDQRHLLPAFYKTIESGNFVVTFNKYSPYPTPSMGDEAEIRKFQNITGQIASPVAGTDPLYPVPTKVKFKLLEWIAKIFRYVNPIISFFSLIAFIILSGFMFSLKYRRFMWEQWMVAFLFLLIALSRILLMSLIWVSQWDGVTSQYLAVSYPFLLLFELLSLMLVWRIINRVLAQRRKKISIFNAFSTGLIK